MYHVAESHAEHVGMALHIAHGGRGRSVIGCRDIIAIEPMAEGSRSSYGVLFQDLKDRTLPRLR